MKNLQIGSGVVIMAFGVLICLEAGRLSFGAPGRPGPAVFPFGLGAVLFVLAAIFTIKTALAGVTITGSARDIWAGLQWRQVPYTLASLLGYALLLDKLGYIICTSILMAYFFWAGGAKRKGFALVGAVVVSVVSYLIFRDLLKVRLPSGPLPI